MRQLQLNSIDSIQSLPISTDAAAHMYDNEYEHLADVIDKIQTDCADSGISPSQPIELLIGGNAPEVFWVEEKRRGKPNQPLAQLTKLGWTVQGASQMPFKFAPSINFIQEPSSIPQELSRLWETDFPEKQHSDVT